MDSESTWRQENSGGQAAAFDAWLHRALRQQYGRARGEPIPDEWLALLDQLPDED